jgi:thymidylate synthase
MFGTHLGGKNCRRNILGFITVISMAAHTSVTILPRFTCLVIYDVKGGIGKGDGQPFYYSEDLKFFKQQTEHQAVIMGRTTYDALPAKFKPLPNRTNIILSSKLSSPPAEGTLIAKSLIEALQLAKQTKKNTYIIGGAVVFKEALSEYPHLCDGIYASEVPQDCECTTLMDLSWQAACDSEIVKTTENYTRKLYKFRNPRHPEEEYLSAVRNVLNTGERRGDRTGVGTISAFGVRTEYDISQRVPLLTTKKVFPEKVIGELLWFISGSTWNGDLKKQGISIWDANASREFLDKRGLTHYEEGDLGPVYGFQWRHFGATYEGRSADYTGKGKDQLAEVVELLRTDPESRRIVLSSWNAAAIEQMALPPCHVLAQFFVREKTFLDCQLYQRSADMFLGVPFNIFSYAVLTYMLAHLTGLRPGKLIHVMGDAHIYQNHVEAVKKQLARTPRAWPTLEIKRQVTSIDDFTLEDFEIKGYNPCPFIKAQMAV